MLRQTQGHSATGMIMAMKNFKDTIGNRTRDLPACSLNQLRHRVSLLIHIIISNVFPFYVRNDCRVTKYWWVVFELQ